MQTYMHVRVIAIRFFNFMLRIIGISRRCHLIDEKMIVFFIHSKSYVLFNFMLRIIGISRRCHLIDEKMIVCFFHSFKTIRIEKLLSRKSLPERPNNF